MKNRDDRRGVTLDSAHGRIRSMVRRDDKIVRLGGDAYVSGATWTADDRTLLSINDGAGWPEIPRDQYWSSRLFTIDGGPESVRFEELSGYPGIGIWDCRSGAPTYYGLNVLAVDGRLYQYLSTENAVFDKKEDGYAWDDFADSGFTHAKLIYSRDGGRTWRNQDGSTPAVLESRVEQRRSNMIFYREPQDAFAQLTFLQMGRDYCDNRDGFVYVYSQNGRTEGTMNELVMFRVPKDRIADREAYRFFAGHCAGGSADWSPDITARRPVHTFPSGLVPKPWPFSWLPSVVFNRPLGIYMMINSNGVSARCIAHDPTYLGLWIANTPWGPWTQVHEETAWMPDHDRSARPVAPLIIPKWISSDGRSLWIAWTDVQCLIGGPEREALSTAMFKATTYDAWKRARRQWREKHPLWGMSAQQIDLTVR